MKLRYAKIHSSLLLLNLIIVSSLPQDRTSEIDEHCNSVLASRIELKPDDSRGERIKTEFSFLNKDCYHGSVNGVLHTLMPQNKSKSSSWLFYLKLVSFWVTKVGSDRLPEDMITIRGRMDIVSYRRPSHISSADFIMAREESRLTGLFEGVYIESNGERLMCLLGTTMRHKAIASSHEKAQLVEDDKILLILRNPNTFSKHQFVDFLTGEMKSLNKKFDPNYFDPVYLSSRFVAYSKNLVVSEQALNACSPYPYEDKLVYDQDVKTLTSSVKINWYRGEDICRYLHSRLSNTLFYVVPTWDSVGVNGGVRLGPSAFTRDRLLSKSDKFEVYVHNLQCRPEHDEENMIKTANVSAEFRVVNSSIDEIISTPSVQGMWNSSCGQLCMAGCVDSTTSKPCSTRVCVYLLPLRFTITDRTIVNGTITSIDEPESRASLLFEKTVRPNDFFVKHQQEINVTWSYTFSKVIEASWFQSRDSDQQLFAGVTELRKLFLTYPSDIRGVSSSRLADELSFCYLAPSFKTNKAEAYLTYVEVEVLALAGLLGQDYKSRQHSEYKDHNTVGERLEVAGKLATTRPDSIMLFFEGLYDPAVGIMYLIGCRHVRDHPTIMINESKPLERGMDCQIEIKIEYPAENIRWLINPRVRISINSARNKEDPLHFSTIRLQTLPVTYNGLEDILFSDNFEQWLQMFILVIQTLSIILQFKYMKKNREEQVSMHVSLVMLGMLALSVTVQFINGIEVLFKWNAIDQSTTTTNSYRTPEAYDREYSPVVLMLTKVQQIVILSTIIAIYKKVRKTRRVACLTKPTLSGKGLRSPSEKMVLPIILFVHFHGFAIFHVIRSSYTSGATQDQDLLTWVGEVIDYSGLVQDFFLFPQIIGNIFWGRIEFKPLSKWYYIGFTCSRVLSSVYHYITDPVIHPVDYQSNELQKLSSEVYSKYGNIAIAVGMIALAAIVQLQQKKVGTKVLASKSN